MKLLILAIYSDSKDYQEMLKIQRSYFHQFKNVTSYFIDFNNDQTNDIEVKDDFIYIKGKNTYLNITYKTVRALEYAIKNLHFDYVIRTNMSTVINIPKLYDFCLQLPRKNIYASGQMLNVQGISHKRGIVNKSVFGTIFAAGTSIIMSNDVVKFMVEHKSKIRYDIVDDVAIGIFMNTYLPTSYYPQNAAYFIVPKNIKPNQVVKNNIFFRNKAYKDRKKDIQNMKIIRNALMKDPLYDTKTKKYIPITLRNNFTRKFCKNK
jgi:hypothetical protein